MPTAPVAKAPSKPKKRKPSVLEKMGFRPKKSGKKPGATPSEGGGA